MQAVREAFPFLRISVGTIEHGPIVAGGLEVSLVGRSDTDDLHDNLAAIVRIVDDSSCPPSNAAASNTTGIITHGLLCYYSSLFDYDSFQHDSRYYDALFITQFWSLYHLLFDWSLVNYSCYSLPTQQPVLKHNND